ncbi:hypothetical protein LZ30DRAFT_317775 [Colletotrichum cereale]|nr:hypothetical protein LZ30DRAFT_317775 [Colletotrichum cereale]
MPNTQHNIEDLFCWTPCAGKASSRLSYISLLLRTEVPSGRITLQVAFRLSRTSERNRLVVPLLDGSSGSHETQAGVVFRCGADYLLNIERFRDPLWLIEPGAKAYAAAVSVALSPVGRLGWMPRANLFALARHAPSTTVELRIRPTSLELSSFIIRRKKKKGPRRKDAILPNPNTDQSAQPSRPSNRAFAILSYYGPPYLLSNFVSGRRTDWKPPISEHPLLLQPSLSFTTLSVSLIDRRPRTKGGRTCGRRTGHIEGDWLLTSHAVSSLSFNGHSEKTHDHGAGIPLSNSRLDSSAPPPQPLVTVLSDHSETERCWLTDRANRSLVRVVGPLCVSAPAPAPTPTFALPVLARNPFYPPTARARPLPQTAGIINLFPDTTQPVMPSMKHGFLK